MNTIPPGVGRRRPSIHQALDELVNGITMAQHLVAPSHYQRDPVAWMVDHLGVKENTLRWSMNPGYEGHRWDGTEEPLLAILQALVDRKNVAVESGTSTGKTFLAACILLWFLHCWENSMVITLAPKAEQLRLHVWKEVRRLWPRFRPHCPRGELLMSLQLRMVKRRDDWTAVGFAVGVEAGAEVATRAQGFHAQHMLFITEETPGISGAILAAVENTLTAPHNLQLSLGNPNHEGDALHKLTQDLNFTPIRISALDHPNVVTGDDTIVPGAASRESNQKRLKKYGPDHFSYLSRVRGVCPAEKEMGLFRLSWMQAAVDRAQELREELISEGPQALGVDVANSEDGDQASICRGHGALFRYVESFPCPDANELGSKVVTLAKAEGIPKGHIGVDGVGVGAGTVNEMKRLRYKPVNLLGGAAPVHQDQEEQFLNLRSQMWWQAREDLREGEVGWEEWDEELVADLLTPTFSIMGKDKIKIESKSEIKKRLRRSPDKGDAYVYWNWVRKKRAGEILIGRA